MAVEINGNQLLWMPSSAAERSLQPYVEEVADEDLLIFRGYQPSFDTGNVGSPCSSDYDYFELECGEDRGAHGFDHPLPMNANGGNALPSWRNEQLPPQKRPSDQCSLERRVRMRMETDVLVNDHKTFAASFASKFSGRRKENRSVKRVHSEQCRYMYRSETRLGR